MSVRCSCRIIEPCEYHMFGYVGGSSNLTWRDVQYITALTSKKIDHTHHSWHQNGAGYWVSSQYGFGLLDAYSYMMTAKHWKTVPEQHNCKITLGRVGRYVSYSKLLVSGHSVFMFLLLLPGSSPKNLH